MFLVAVIYFSYFVVRRVTTIQQMEVGSKVLDKHTLQVLESKHIAKVKSLLKSLNSNLLFV